MLSLLQVMRSVSREQAKNDETHNVRKERPHCRGKPHGEKSCREPLGCKICAGYPNAHDGERIMQKGKTGTADGTEVAAEAELEAGEKAVPHIAPQM